MYKLSANYQSNNEFSELQCSQPLDQETEYYQHPRSPQVPPLGINILLSRVLTPYISFLCF